jgi:hypothetical protein
MNLVFPTFLEFPIYPVRPTENDDDAVAAFMEALRDFFQHFVRQNTNTRRYYDAVNFYFDVSDQENLDRRESAHVSQQAIAAVIKNIRYPVREEYVWDPNRNCWVLKTIPM